MCVCLHRFNRRLFLFCSPLIWWDETFVNLHQRNFCWLKEEYHFNRLQFVSVSFFLVMQDKSSLQWHHEYGKLLQFHLDLMMILLINWHNDFSVKQQNFKLILVTIRLDRQLFITYFYFPASICLYGFWIVFTDIQLTTNDCRKITEISVSSSLSLRWY